jgi:hypothetical protein
MLLMNSPCVLRTVEREEEEEEEEEEELPFSLTKPHRRSSKASKVT